MLGIVAALVSSPADAALQKYRLNRIGASNTDDVTPNPDLIPHGTSRPGEPSQAVVLLDQAAGPNPRLRKINDITDRTVTVLVPGLATNIFVSVSQREGAGTGIFTPGGGTKPVFTGTGSSASQIRWGTVTGWTVSGRWWCNSNPAIICSLAMLIDEATAQARFNSTFYDLGTWYFHGTGFTSQAFVHSYNTNNFGNFQWIYQAGRNTDTTVPALPLLGLALIGGSLVAGGVVVARRRN
jgi:hypothetical protein